MVIDGFVFVMRKIDIPSFFEKAVVDFVGASKIGKFCNLFILEGDKESYYNLQSKMNLGKSPTTKFRCSIQGLKNETSNLLYNIIDNTRLRKKRKTNQTMF